MAEKVVIEFTAKDRELKSLIDELVRLGKVTDKDAEKFRKLGNQADQAGGKFRKASPVVKEFFGAFAGYLSVGLATQAVKQAIIATADLEDQLANVRKTTQLSSVEVNKLNRELQKLNTRTSQSELLDLATTAGKLGIQGTENVLAFVRAADKINIALGEDLGEGAVRTIGKLNTVFGVTKELGIEDSILATGSAINSLAQSGTAAEQEIVNFAEALGAIGKQAGFTLPEILAIGSTLSETSVPAETAATALTQVFIRIKTQAEDFGKAAGLAGEDLDQFVELVGKDTPAAFNFFLKQLNETSPDLQSFANRLDEIGFEGKRVVTTLSNLADQQARLQDNIALSTDEFGKQTSVVEEAAVKNLNLAASLDKLSKAIGNAITNATQRSLIPSLINNLAELISGTDEASDSFERLEGETDKAFNERVQARAAAINKRIGELRDVITDYKVRLKFANDEAERNAIANALDRVNGELETQIQLLNVLNGLDPSGRFKQSQLDELRRLDEHNEQMRAQIRSTLELIKAEEERRQKEGKKARVEMLKRINAEREKERDLLDDIGDGIERIDVAIDSFGQDQSGVLSDELVMVVDLINEYADAVAAGPAAVQKLKNEWALVNRELAKLPDQLEGRGNIITPEIDFDTIEGDLQKIKDELLQFGSQFGGILTGIIAGDDSAVQQLEAQFDRIKDRYDDDVAALEEANDRKLLSDNAYRLKLKQLDKKREQEEKALEDRIRQAKVKQFKAQQSAAIAEIIIQQGIALARVAGQTGIAFPIFAALVTAFTAAQVALVASQPVPKFAKGVIGLKGPGTGTSDSIPAQLSKGESVMTAKETAAFTPTLMAIRKGIADPSILNQIAVNPQLGDVTASIDTGKLTRSYRKTHGSLAQQIGREVARNMQNNVYPSSYRR